MAGLIVIIEYLIFVFMVVASFGIAHLGLKLLELLDAYLSTERRRPDRGSADRVALRRVS